jgi:hypothetical protein
MVEMVRSSVLGLNGYIPPFLSGVSQGNDPNKMSVPSKYYTAIEDDIFYKIGALAGHEEDVDTSLEFVLATYYSPAVVSIRPPEAAAVLPAENPRLSGLKLGAAVYKELVELKFLDPRNTAAIGRYEGMLHFISGRNGVSTAEIKSYFEQGIGALVAETVDAEFNKISFLLNNSTANSIRGHNSILTRDAKTGHYTLSYGGSYTNNETRTITANSLEALSSEMRNGRYKADFDQTGIDQVNAQAALIPAAVYARWQTIGVAQGTDALALIKDTLTRFYLEPNRTNYEAARGIYARYHTLEIPGDPLAVAAGRSFSDLLASFSPGLNKKIRDEIFVTGHLPTMAGIPNDRRFNIFSTRSDVGGGGR